MQLYWKFQSLPFVVYICEIKLNNSNFLKIFEIIEINFENITSFRVIVFGRFHKQTKNSSGSRCNFKHLKILYHYGVKINDLKINTQETLNLNIHMNHGYIWMLKATPMISNTQWIGTFERKNWNDIWMHCEA